ncbi:hypothetical protein Tco_1129234 [Tanacetum coccineum]
MLRLQRQLVVCVDLCQMLLDARIDISLVLGIGLHVGLQDPRLLLCRDVVPRMVVHRELPDDLTEEVSPMSRVVTERHLRASIAPLKLDRLRAMKIRDPP